MPFDLTPFGFTPTEGLAYGALLELGPASGYTVARHLSVARANAYQALDGLVTKGAAALVATEPRRYRARQPQTLFAAIVDAQTRRLDRLEDQLRGLPRDGEGGPVQLSGSRAVREVATRAVVRAEGPVRCVGPGKELEALAPALRARVASGRKLEAWVAGPAGSLPLDAGSVDEGRMAGYFGGPALLLHAVGEGALAALVLGDASSGFWSGDRLLSGMVVGVIDALTG